MCDTKRPRERVILCCSERSLEELEEKRSDLRRELVMVQEALSHLTLQKDMLEDDKASLALALSKVSGGRYEVQSHGWNLADVDE